jgi:hypothetical protein
MAAEYCYNAGFASLSATNRGARKY